MPVNPDLKVSLTHDCKDDDDGEHGGEAVGESHDEGVPHAIVVGRVVRGVSDLLEFR